jgi:hypothetical protein
VLFHVQQVGDLGPAPAVNALVIVPHHAEVSVFLGQRLHQLELARVGVLILVDHHIPILCPACLQGLRMFFEQPQGQQDQVIKIHRVACPQRRFILRPHMAGHSRQAFVAKSDFFGRILDPAKLSQNGRGVEGVELAVNLAQHLLDGAKLLGFVVDNEIAFASFSMCSRKMRTQSEWNVHTVGRAGGGDSPVSADFFARFAGSSLRKRSSISRAALLVNVTPRILPGAMPC